MLSVSNLCVAYGSIQAVRGVDLEVPDGHLVAIVGANGAGKSSTMNALGGLLKPAAGKVLLDGRPVGGKAAHTLVRLGIGLVPEGRMVAPGLTVWENLRQCRQRHRCTPAAFGAEIDRIYQLFPVLRTRKSQLAGSLSGGEQQMLAIGRALATQPRVLLLDEPSMGLAPSVVDIVFSAVLEIHKQGQTILLVEQNAELALELCDYALVLQRGEIAAQGTPGSLRETDAFVTAFMG